MAQEWHDWWGFDMWAAGIFAFFVAVGAYPFELDDGVLTLLNRISSVEFDQVRKQRHH